ncbi:helix-turn-helix transcriptional regulator [Algoriphagus sp. CAU 1675]|uniref:helix-turn-helix domain-containing protein n=1 Tax=Algoriphagus sp. CAU 1675 TaxID=3032597 RepID=UPI0023DBD4DC|nr:helix-turn-helix transcriptional regulator [Algoriphagus sp. CAU 1675]MDF2157236.1 helix-turn-helix transcriptional regulator [Algoriphagus sp. CAU 1675]
MASQANTIAQFNAYVGQETLHPLISVVDFSKLKPFKFRRGQLGVYAIFLKEVKCGDIIYGCHHYDYEEGSLLFVSPDQVYGIESDDAQQAKGKAIIFHPDLLLGTALGRNMDSYTFFSYEVNEALHLSERERATVNDCFEKIKHELEQTIDKHSKTLITSNLELLLQYSMRFYDRQFITRHHVNTDVLARFEQVLSNYFQSEKPLEIGLPSVAFCAAQINLSPNYLGDLIKKETGKSAQEHIQSKLIEYAKRKIQDSSKNISEVAYELGFKYPQHFTRMFKRATGYTPQEFKLLN